MLSQRSQLWPVAGPVFIAALLLFVVNIVVGILNGLDIYEPDHDTLITHVHAGTLGWISLAVGGTALLMFSRDRAMSERDVSRGTALGWALIGAITLYVAAFLVGDRIPGDRIQRPVVGTLLFLVVIWFVVWLFKSNRAYARSSVARLGMLLAWVSMLIGASFGVVLGIYTSQDEVPGLSDDTAAAVAEAHPPAMVIGFLILAAFAVIEWLIQDEKTWAESRLGATMMWLVFAGGVLVNVAFVSGLEEELLGPANLIAIAIVGVGILVGRSWRKLIPAGWREAGTGIYPRLSILLLIIYLALLTVIIVRIVSGAMDIDALTETEFGLILTFDHVMFIGVMTNVLFGVLSSSLHGTALKPVDRVLLWGVNLGILGFGLGLITVTPWLKRISTPVMGIALLIGIVYYVNELRRHQEITVDAEAAL